jgi:hypothetical protein
MVKIIKSPDMPTNLVKVPDVLQVFYKENEDAVILEFTVSEDNTLIIREPEIEDDLTTFFSEVSLADWLVIRNFVDRNLNR